MISRSGVRWQIEEDSEQNKQFVGLDQYQVRKWTPWHRQATSCTLTHAFLAVQHARHDNGQDLDYRRCGDPMPADLRGWARPHAAHPLQDLRL